jgi:hypothetical protein
MLSGFLAARRRRFLFQPGGGFGCQPDRQAVREINAIPLVRSGELLKRPQVHALIAAFKSLDRVDADPGIFGHLAAGFPEQSAGSAGLAGGADHDLHSSVFLCLFSRGRLTVIRLRPIFRVSPEKRQPTSLSSLPSFDQPNMGSFQPDGNSNQPEIKLMTSKTLAPIRTRQSAADSWKRARNAVRFAREFPHCAEREMRTAQYWKESAQFWRSQAELDAAPAVIVEERRWVSSPSWEAELELLFGCPVAVAAEVE